MNHELLLWIKHQSPINCRRRRPGQNCQNSLQCNRMTYSVTFFALLVISDVRYWPISVRSEVWNCFKSMMVAMRPKADMSVPGPKHIVDCGKRIKKPFINFGEGLLRELWGRVACKNFRSLYEPQNKRGESQKLPYSHHHSR